MQELVNLPSPLKNFRIIFLVVIYRAACAFCLLFLVACTDDRHESPSSSLFSHSSGSCTRCKEFFSFKNLSLTRIDGSNIKLRIYADRVIGRPRMGRLVMFENYDEIYLNHLIAEQPQKSKVVNFDLQSIVKAFNVFDDGNQGDQVQPEEESLLGEGTIGDTGISTRNHRMSRILVDNISINMKPNNQRLIVLTADHAKMVINSSLIKFERNVNLKAAKCVLTSPVAMWSSKYTGLFLPEIYKLNGKTHKPNAFYQVTHKGRCIMIKPPPFVEYVDMLDTAEDKLFETLPPNIRLLFGFVGLPLQ